MSAYYNDMDPAACAWLRELIAGGHLPDGEVDDRSIADVQPDDLRGYTQHHFFAGIGGWAYALRLAGMPDGWPCWTGSPPCQCISSAARGRNKSPDLWGPYRDLLAECRPAILFGEQVANDSAWADRACGDLEDLGYAVGTAILPALLVGADHARPRLYFTGYADSYRQPSGPVYAKAPRLPRLDGHAFGDVPPDGIPASVAKRGFGNAIVPQVGAAFIRASLDAIADVSVWGAAE